MNRPDGSGRRDRCSLRLEGYDYAQAGAYFVTVVVQARLLLFGDVVDGEMRLNQAGAMVTRVWEEMPDRFPNIEMDAFVVMPNHIHGIIVIVGRPSWAPKTPGQIRRGTPCGCPRPQGQDNHEGCPYEVLSEASGGAPTRRTARPPVVRQPSMRPSRAGGPDRSPGRSQMD